MDKKADSQYVAVDVAKVLLAIAIIIEHVHLFWINQPLQAFYDRNLFPLVLPLFFFFSGFFFLKNRQVDWGYSYKKIKRLLILYGVWLIPNLPTAYMKLKGMGGGTNCFYYLF